MAETKTVHDGQIVRSIFLTVIASVFTYLHYLYTPSLLTLLLTLTGSFIYVSFLQMNRLEVYRRFDYIQSGEGLLFGTALLLFFFLDISLLHTFLLLLLTSAALSFFQKFIMEQKPAEIFYTGMIINATCVFLCAYLILQFGDISLSPLLYGYYSSVNFLIFSGVVIACGIILMLIFPVFRPVFQLYTHGPTFFAISGISYISVSVIITLVRSFFLTTAFLSTGLCNGIGNYIYAEKTIFSAIQSLLIIIAYSQALFFITVFTENFAVLGISIILSYIVYYFLGKKNYYSMQEKTKWS